MKYGEQQAVIGIEGLVVIDGQLAPRVLGMVMEWAVQHQESLMDLWDRAQNSQPLCKLPPLL